MEWNDNASGNEFNDEFEANSDNADLFLLSDSDSESKSSDPGSNYDDSVKGRENSLRA